MYEKILEISRQFLTIKHSAYRRYLIRSVSFTHRLSVIVGARGVGKTTTLVQFLLDMANGDKFSSEILYVQADHFVLGKTSLYEIAEQFKLLGGKWLAIDEIHKYPEWSKELKSIYDTFPNLQLIVSGSSALEIYKGSPDLIRRAISYEMRGLSFREYLELNCSVEFSSYSLQEICVNHERITSAVIDQLSKIGQTVLSLFQDYLKNGYYPYFFEINHKDFYRITLEQNLHMTIESDLVAIFPHLTGSSIKKIKQLLMFIAHSVPFIPNWQKIMTAIDIGDSRTLKSYFAHLEDASLIRSIAKSTKKLQKLESPEKIYLDNPNQLFAICSTRPEKGTVRETFFLNSLSMKHRVTLPANGDFLVDDSYLFEIGGRRKNFEQIKNHQNSFVASDDMEQGVGKKIPLWLFGFLY